VGGEMRSEWNRKGEGRRVMNEGGGRRDKGGRGGRGGTRLGEGGGGGGGWGG